MAIAAVVAILGATAHAADKPSTDTHDIDGVYWIERYSPTIQPLDGQAPPYKPEAMAQYRKNMAAVKDNTLDDPARRLCVPDGVPRILGNPYPFELVQIQGLTHILYEINHAIRRVEMDKPMPSDADLAPFPFYDGHSVGRWDGDTLIVETAGFNEKTYLDNSGAPHTDQLRTVERIRKINGGKELEDVVTIHDPGVFTKDWQTRFVYASRPDIRIMDYNCGEKHRDISGVPGVHPR